MTFIESRDSFSAPAAASETRESCGCGLPVSWLSKLIFDVENKLAPFAAAPLLAKYSTTILFPAEGDFPNIVPSLNVSS